MALQGHLLEDGGHQHQLSGLQGELRLGIGHSAGACLGHKGHKGIGILQQLVVGDHLHAPAPQLFLKQYTNL